MSGLGGLVEGMNIQLQSQEAKENCFKTGKQDDAED